MFAKEFKIAILGFSNEFDFSKVMELDSVTP